MRRGGTTTHPVGSNDAAQATFDLLLRVSSPDARGAHHDVVARVRPDHTVGELVAALAAEIGASAGAGSLLVERTGTTASAETTVASLDLRSGDGVVLGGSPRPSVDPPPRSLVLDVVSGPDSGRSFPLRVGGTTIGRGRRADVTLTDPTISRLHATVRVATDGSVSIVAERDAVNATMVDDIPACTGRSHALADGTRVALGASELVLRLVERPVSAPPVAGTVEFHRTPYRPGVVAPVELAPIGPIPTRPQARRLQLIAVLAPLVAGLGMFLIVGQTHFLLFTLISPIVMIGTAFDDRRTGRRSHASSVAEFRAMLATRRQEVARLAEVERRQRHRSAPDLAVLIRRAEHRSVDLWSRGRSAPDVLHLRVGRGDDTAAASIELERGGEIDLREEAANALAGADRLMAVPITVDLGRDILAVHGTHELVTGVAASLVVQAATLHSPDDLTIVTAVGPARELGWAKWLPHVRSASSPVRGTHMATDASTADELIESLLDVAAFRADRRRDRERTWPMVLTILDADAGADAVAVARLLDLAPAASIAVVWLADSVAAVPRHAGRVLHVGIAPDGRMEGRLWSTDPEVADRHLDVEHIRPDIAERAARALAPIRDASAASPTSAIPRHAALLDVVGVDASDPAVVVGRWSARRYAPDLRFAIGLTAHGRLLLDLVDDGPHALIGGTSGAGKSELLQSMVASLAAEHSPERLNFLFVDYKGGASSQVFQRLPHTVGYVTNLSADLASRALTSLRAELDRRMAMLEGRAKDLAELLEREPDTAPPSLVIVVDEFATLVKEVPDFMTGVVDIAQRGRSLGIHLVLATQRPTGTVDENILANTNLRIALRMLDRSESTSVIGCADAADIPVPLRGRGIVRRGPGRITEFQSAFAGTPWRGGTGRADVSTAPFDQPQARPAVGRSADSDGGGTQLDVVLDAIVAANARLAIPEPRRPWRDPLPEVVTLDELIDDRSATVHDVGRGRLPIGLLDAPERQEQRVAVIDVEATGGVAVIGSSGTGKTTLLRTLAVAADRAAADGASITTVVFDAAGRGLAAVGGLPSVVDVAPGDDLEAVTRQLLALDAELGRRRRRFAEVGADTLTAVRSAGDLPRVLVLVDGFEELASQLIDLRGPLAGGGEEWSDRFQRLVVDGRRLGIHTVIAASRRGVLPARLYAAIGARLVLRHVDPHAYAELGIRPDRATALEAAPGRALLDDVTIQLAVADQDAPAARWTARADRDPVPAGRRLVGVALPDALDPLQVPGATEPGSTVVGRTDVVGGPATIDLEWSHLAVVGPPRSGRSTALAAVVAGMHPDEHVIAVGPASSPLARVGDVLGRVGDRAFGDAGAVGEVLDRAANIAALAAEGERVVVVVDDLDGFDDPMVSAVFDRLLSCDRVRLVAAVGTRAMSGYAVARVVAELRRARRLLVLRPDDPNELLQLTGVKVQVRPGLRWVPGRGVLLVDRVPTVVQVANVGGRHLRRQVAPARLDEPPCE